MTLVIHTINWHTNGELAREIRHQVFIKEQHIPPQQEWDDADGEADTQHLVALVDDRAVATGRITRRQRIGRLAVLKPYRGTGVGAALLRACVQLALRLQQQATEPRIFLHAQVYAVPFYQKNGFRAYGEAYIEDGIAHRSMVWLWKHRSAQQSIFQGAVLRLSKVEAFQQHLFLMASASRRYLDILCDDLQADIYRGESLAAAISQFVRHQRTACVRILVKNSASLRGSDHPLLCLAQRLSSKMAIRVYTPDNYSEKKQRFALFDRQTMVFFNSEKNLAGFANYAAPAQARQALEVFEQCWTQHSISDPYLEPLNL